MKIAVSVTNYARARPTYPSARMGPIAISLAYWLSALGRVILRIQSAMTVLSCVFRGLIDFLARAMRIFKRAEHLRHVNRCSLARRGLHVLMRSMPRNVRRARHAVFHIVMFQHLRTVQGLVKSAHLGSRKAPRRLASTMLACAPSRPKVKGQSNPHEAFALRQWLNSSHGTLCTPVPFAPR